MRELLKVARLQFLISGLAPFLAGALVAATLGAPLASGKLLLGYLVVAAAQLSVHFSNDYFDTATDLPGGGTLISGGGDVLLMHPELREPAKWIAIGLLSLSLVAGILFVILFSYPLWVVGLLIFGNLLGWVYSAPPWRLSDRGWGEACYTFNAGFVVPAVGYLALRGVLDSGIAFFLPPLLVYALASVLSAEIPDWEADRAGGKHNWIERLGRRRGFKLIGILLAAVTLYFFLLPRLLDTLPAYTRHLGWLSVLPVLPGLAGLLGQPVARRSATRLAIAIIIALAIFGVLLDAYLFFVARH